MSLFTSILRFTPFSQLYTLSIYLPPFFEVNIYPLCIHIYTYICKHFPYLKFPGPQFPSHANPLSTLHHAQENVKTTTLISLKAPMGDYLGGTSAIYAKKENLPYAS